MIKNRDPQSARYKVADEGAELVLDMSKTAFIPNDSVIHSHKASDHVERAFSRISYIGVPFLYLPLFILLRSYVALIYIRYAVIIAATMVGIKSNNSIC